MRGVMGLPRPVQRVVAGRPRRSEGQTLAPDLQAMLRLMRLVREPELGSVGVAESRATYRHQTAVAGGRQPIGEVREVAVGDRAGRLYVPRGVVGRGPLLVWFHGGGFMYGDLDTHDPGCRFLAERAGVRVLSVDYRLGPEDPFPAAFDDAEAAYAWVVEHADDAGCGPRTARSRRRLGRRHARRPRRDRGCARRVAARLAAAALPVRGRPWHQREPRPLRPGPAPDPGDVRRGGRELPHRRRRRDRPAGVAGARRPAAPGSRRRTSRPPASTRCATRARTTPVPSGMRGRTPSCGGSPTSCTASSTSSAWAAPGGRRWWRWPSGPRPRWVARATRRSGSPGRHRRCSPACRRRTRPVPRGARRPGERCRPRRTPAR